MAIYVRHCVVVAQLAVACSLAWVPLASVAAAACTAGPLTSMAGAVCTIGNVQFSFPAAMSIRNDYGNITTKLADLYFTPLAGADGFTITGPLTVPNPPVGQNEEGELDWGNGLSGSITTVNGTSTIAGVTTYAAGAASGTATGPFSEFNVIDASNGSNLAYAQPNIAAYCQNSKSCTAGLSSSSASTVHFGLIALGGIVGQGGTVTSTMTTFIVDEGATPLPTGSSSSHISPVLPAPAMVTTPDGPSFEESFPVTAGDTIPFDPLPAVAYLFTVHSGPSFSSVTLPAIAGSNYVLHFFDGTADVSVLAGQKYTFSHAVAKFEVLGISAGANLDPTSGTAFATTLSFTGDGIADFYMTPLTAVPEAGTGTLLLAGLGAIGLVTRRRRRR